MEDTNRLEELVTKYENTLFRAALAILREPQEAQDAVQDVYVRYLEKRPRFQDGEHAKAWLLKVTANGCKSRLRSRKRHPAVELLDVYPAPDPDSGELVEAILALPANQRAAVHLHYYEGYSTGEIAQMLRVSQSSVTSRLCRARKKLKEQLEQEGYHETGV